MFVLPTEIKFANAAQVLQQGLQALPQSGYAIDCIALEACDSSAIAVLLAWQRNAPEQRLQFMTVPTCLQRLAKLYGVNHILGIAV